MSFKPLVQIFRASGIVQTVAASEDINVKHKFGLRVKKASFADLSDEALAKSEAAEAESGERGIRTLGTVAHTTVFETVPFDHSGTSPGNK